jgi:hypothetical protein
MAHGRPGIICPIARRSPWLNRLAAGIALAIIPVMNGLGAKLNMKFASINSSLK